MGDYLSVCGFLGVLVGLCWFARRMVWWYFGIDRALAALEAMERHGAVWAQERDFYRRRGQRGADRGAA